MEVVTVTVLLPSMYIPPRQRRQRIQRVQIIPLGRWSRFESGWRSHSSGKSEKCHKFKRGDRGSQINSTGNGVGLSQGERSLPAGKVRESTTSSVQGGEGQSVNPVGRWTVT
eukprot:1941212-Prymnesium_polylepis.2